MRILIAEKDPYGRRLLEQTLRMEGYEVFIAEAGKQARNQLYRLRPDLVLMNVFHSQRNGREPLKQIRVRCNEGKDPVIFVSCMGQCDEMYFLDGSSQADISMFDHLPSKMKMLIVDTIQQLCAAVNQFKRWARNGAGFAMKLSFSLDELETHPLQGILYCPTRLHRA